MPPLFLCHSREIEIERERKQERDGERVFVWVSVRVCETEKEDLGFTLQSNSGSLFRWFLQMCGHIPSFVKV